MTTPIEPTRFYLAFDPNDRLFANNVFVGKGRLMSTGYGRDIGEIPVGAMSQYEAFTREWDKEEGFERIRGEEFPDLPSRMGAIFLFPDEETAHRANKLWWSDGRVILPAVVYEGSKVGVFDSHKLDAGRDAWSDAARDYWRGATTSDPLLEVVVQGNIQVSGWEPYAHLG